MQVPLEHIQTTLTVTEWSFPSLLFVSCVQQAISPPVNQLNMWEHLRDMVLNQG